jgi:hypothetical protein
VGAAAAKAQPGPRVFRPPCLPLSLSLSPSASPSTPPPLALCPSHSPSSGTSLTSPAPSRTNARCSSFIGVGVAPCRGPLHTRKGDKWPSLLSYCY